MRDEKFMMSLRQPVFGLLKKEAKGRGISLQEHLRANIVPAWTERNNGEQVIDADKLIRFIKQHGLNGQTKAKRK